MEPNGVEEEEEEEGEEEEEEEVGCIVWECIDAAGLEEGEGKDERGQCDGYFGMIDSFPR